MRPSSRMSAISGRSSSLVLRLGAAGAGGVFIRNFSSSGGAAATVLRRHNLASPQVLSLTGTVLSNIVIATRESRLAMWQAEHVKALLQEQGHTVSLLGMTTRGDQILDR